MSYKNLFILLLFSAALSQAQKIKYKNLYPLLESRQFEVAKPLLKRYLIQEPEEANAYLQMGFIHSEELEYIHPILSSKEFVAVADSSIVSYQTAYELIDDRELRKNDEYYQSYNRRDMRTGKFEIKLSDIQLDIKQRIETIEKQKRVAEEMGDTWEKASKKYNLAASRVKSLQYNYKWQEYLLLQSTPNIYESLNQIKAGFDSSIILFNELNNGYKGFHYDKEPFNKLEEEVKLLLNYKDVVDILNFSDWTSKTIDEKKRIEQAGEELQLWIRDSTTDITQALTVLQPYDDEGFIPKLQNFLLINPGKYNLKRFVNLDSIPLKRTYDTLQAIDNLLKADKQQIIKIKQIDFTQLPVVFSALSANIEPQITDFSNQIDSLQAKLDSALNIVTSRQKYVIYKTDTISLDFDPVWSYNTSDQTVLVKKMAVDSASLESFVNTTGAADSDDVNADSTMAENTKSVLMSHNLVLCYNDYGFAYSMDTVSFTFVNNSIGLYACQEYTYIPMPANSTTHILMLSSEQPGIQWIKTIPFVVNESSVSTCLGESLVISNKEKVIRITKDGEITN